MDPKPPPYRGRFAPSPTGRLHFGSLVAALGSWLMARSNQGTWLVRIEDLDPPREVRGADLDILATLAAFGMESDEPPVYQSHRTADHERAFDRLHALGCVYPCWCSRTDLAPFDGLHPVACVASRDDAREAAWRMRVPARVISFDDAIQGRFAQDLAREVGDFVIRRADGWYAYQLAVVIDDAAQGVTDVVRGADLIDSTPRQLLLQELLDLPRMGYAHLPLALGDDGQKLSKHVSALAVDADDPLPALRAALAFLGQIPPAQRDVASTLADALERFDARRIPATARAPAPFAALRKEVS
jgi:glutamyl-Q tRNA(Asp) synthetase